MSGSNLFEGCESNNHDDNGYSECDNNGDERESLWLGVKGC